MQLANSVGLYQWKQGFCISQTSAALETHHFLDQGQYAVLLQHRTSSFLSFRRI